MDFYSLTLLLALLAGGLAVAAAVAGLLRPRREATASFRAKTAAQGLATAAVALALVSAASHLVGGHGPGSPEPMQLGEFVRGHPAYPLVAVLAAGALLLAGLGRDRTGA